MKNSQSILDELHTIREQLLEESGGTLEGLVARLQKEQRESGRIVLKTRRTKHCIEVADQPLPDGGSSAATR
jgi:superfamily II helicase